MKMEEMKSTYTNRKPANWESKLGVLTPKVGPDEVIFAIMNGGRERALEMLESIGHLPIIPGVPGAFTRNVAEYYNVDKKYLGRTITKVHRYGSPFVSDRKAMSPTEIVGVLKKNGTKCVIRDEHDQYIITVCGDTTEEDSGCGCDQFKVPKRGWSAVHEPEVALAVSVLIFTGRYRDVSSVASTLVNKIVCSDYIDDALSARAQRHSQFAQKARDEVFCDCAEEVCPQVKTATEETHEAAEGSVENHKGEGTTTVHDRQLDTYKTTIALLWNLTTMLAAPTLNEVMPGQMESVMKQLTESGVAALEAH